MLKEEAILQNERFALDADHLYLFSSSQMAMMPGNIAIRTVRIERTFATDRDVKANRAQDKVSLYVPYLVGTFFIVNICSAVS